MDPPCLLQVQQVSELLSRHAILLHGGMLLCPLQDLLPPDTPTQAMAANPGAATQPAHMPHSQTKPSQQQHQQPASLTAPSSMARGQQQDQRSDGRGGQGPDGLPPPPRPHAQGTHAPRVPAAAPRAVSVAAQSDYRYSPEQFLEEQEERGQGHRTPWGAHESGEAGTGLHQDASAGQLHQTLHYSPLELQVLAGRRPCCG